MPVFRVNVKWNKEKFANVECNTDDSPEYFKAALFSLTGVPPERQKVMVLGKMLSDKNFDDIKLKDGMTMMLIGSAEAVVNVDTKVVPEDQVACIQEDYVQLPCGLVNIGNTCYVNAVVQLLYSVPELRLGLQVFHETAVQPTVEEVSRESLCANLRFTFALLGQTYSSFTPIKLINSLHKVCSQFAKLSGQGEFEQQDASECWIEFIRSLQKLTFDGRITARMQKKLPLCFDTSSAWNPIDRFFTGQMLSTLSCTESDEAVSESSDSFTQLSCFMSQEVKYLLTGIRNGFEETLTKMSPSLQRNAVYKKVSKIARLPAYVPVHLVRFFYKEDKQINAKILKDVKFPLSLDLYEFCTSELQTKLFPMRERMRLAEEEELSKNDGNKDANKRKVTEEPDVYKIEEMYEPPYFPEDIGSNNSGYYELKGLVSHQGRTSSSGHYVAWIKSKDLWFKCNDDSVSQVTTEDILRLSGGGDWHCAYILLYGPRLLNKNAGKGETNGNATVESSSLTVPKNGDHRS